MGRTIQALSIGAAFALSLPANAQSEKTSSGHLVCMKYSTFQMLDDESIVAGSGDIEDMSLTISGPDGDFMIKEGEVWATPEGERRLVASHGKTSVYRMPGDSVRYAAFGPLAGEKDKLVIWLSGPAFDGSSRDIEILSRFEVRDPGRLDCEKSFTYSWPDRWVMRIEEDN